jgi:hypothetical protein
MHREEHTNSEQCVRLSHSMIMGSLVEQWVGEPLCVPDDRRPEIAHETGARRLGIAKDRPEPAKDDGSECGAVIAPHRARLLYVQPLINPARGEALGILQILTRSRLTMRIGQLIEPLQ